jgi:hypothetical protein
LNHTPIYDVNQEDQKTDGCSGRKLVLAGADDVITTVWGRGYLVSDAKAMPHMPIMANEQVVALAAVAGSRGILPVAA